jgi:hypothetical protein
MSQSFGRVGSYARIFFCTIHDALKQSNIITVLSVDVYVYV